jgi:hypothetical protein
MYWWNFSPFCNIWDVVEFEFCLQYILPMILDIFCLYIFCFSSVTGKRRGLTNPRHHCYGQETRTNEPASPLLWARDED